MAEEIQDLMDISEFSESQYLDFTDEPIVAPVEPNSEPATDPVEPTHTETQTSDWLSEFNKSIGANYSDVEELKNILGEYGSLKEKVSKIDDFDAISSRLEKAEKERNLLIEKYRELKDPQSFFADDVEYKRNQLMKSNPEINGEVARKALTIDLATANPLDIIALSMQLTHSRLSGGEVGAKEAFLLSKGIDLQVAEDGSVDTNDLTRAQMNVINLEAEKAAKDIASIRSSIPEVQASKEVEDLIAEWTAQQQQPQFDVTKWDGKIDDVVKSVDVFEVKDGDTVLYSEPISEEFKDGLKEAVLEAITKGGIEPTPENIKILADEAKKEYAFENMPSIMKRVESHLKKKIEEQQHQRVHNDVDPDRGTTTTGVNTQRGYTTPLNKVLGLG